jgi:hypothetical protein
VVATKDRRIMRIDLSDNYVTVEISAHVEKKHFFIQNKVWNDHLKYMRMYMYMRMVHKMRYVCTQISSKFRDEK